jgi:hypothetical protein
MCQQAGRELDEDVPAYDLGSMEPFSRADLYGEREDTKLAR